LLTTVNNFSISFCCSSSIATNCVFFPFSILRKSNFRTGSWGFLSFSFSLGFKKLAIICTLCKVSNSAEASL
jgi:hypothetical protein